MTEPEHPPHIVHVPAPSIGRIVRYKLTEEDADKINRRRQHAQDHIEGHRTNATGVQIHYGNYVCAGASLPMVITAVWPTSVNGKVFLDGNDDYWVTSAPQGPNQGNWEWPPRD